MGSRAPLHAGSRASRSRLAAPVTAAFLCSGSEAHKKNRTCQRIFIPPGRRCEPGGRPPGVLGGAAASPGSRPWPPRGPRRSGSRALRRAGSRGLRCSRLQRPTTAAILEVSVLQRQHRGDRTDQLCSTRPEAAQLAAGLSASGPSCQPARAGAPRALAIEARPLRRVEAGGQQPSPLSFPPNSCAHHSSGGGALPPASRAAAAAGISGRCCSRPPRSLAAAPRGRRPPPQPASPPPSRWIRRFTVCCAVSFPLVGGCPCSL